MHLKFEFLLLASYSHIRYSYNLFNMYNLKNLEDVPIMLGHILFPNVKGQGMIHGYCSHCSINSYPISCHYHQQAILTYISHKPQFLFLD